MTKRPLAVFGIVWHGDITYRWTAESILRTEWPGRGKFHIALPPNRTCPVDQKQEISEAAAGAVVIASQPVGLLTPAACTFIARWALALEAEYVFIAHSDVGWPGDALKRLLAHDKDVVAGWSRGRMPPHSIHVADEYLPERNSWRIATEPRDGLEKVAAFGGGMWCIKTDVFRSTPYPWWDWEACPNGEIRTEDFFMCRKFQEHGFECWVDWDLCNDHLVNGIVVGRDGIKGA